MHLQKRPWLVLVALVVLVKIFSVFPAAVERYYSTGIYPLMTRLMRFLLGWLPFSVGDILYSVAGIWLLVKLARLVKAVVKRKAGWSFWWNGFRWLAFYSLLVYSVFNILWGLNYNRLGTAYQLQLEMKPYTTGELTTVIRVLLRRLDSTNAQALTGRSALQSKRFLFDGAWEGYEAAARRYPHLVYRNQSVKPSLFSYLGDYMGYTGYYNPFTGEAQVNTTVPVFVQPFTTCHEIGHQLGYAKENEANFAGFLSAQSSPDPAFRYSVYLDMYNYGRRELYQRDSALAIAIDKQKPLQVKKDFAELRAFYAAYENPIEPYIRLLYGQYLRANEQPSGMQSYSEVMAFLVAYYKKYGEEGL
jgi:Protein of unknown function (DUF3810)